LTFALLRIVAVADVVPLRIAVVADVGVLLRIVAVVDVVPLRIVVAVDGNLLEKRRILWRCLL
jgi:hypothetical protein